MRLSRLLLCVLALSAAAPAFAQSEFPFDSELIFDVAPMRGSKKIPNMDVSADGAMTLEMWCNQVKGRLVVAGNTITVLTESPTARQCPPERVQGDTELMAALADVTTWKRDGDKLLLIGTKTLRLRLPTN